MLNEQGSSTNPKPTTSQRLLNNAGTPSPAPAVQTRSEGIVPQKQATSALGAERLGLPASIVLCWIQFLAMEAWRHPLCGSLLSILSMGTASCIASTRERSGQVQADLSEGVKRGVRILKPSRSTGDPPIPSAMGNQHRLVVDEVFDQMNDHPNDTRRNGVRSEAVQQRCVVPTRIGAKCHINSEQCRGVRGIASPRQNAAG